MAARYGVRAWGRGLAAALLAATLTAAGAGADPPDFPNTLLQGHEGVATADGAAGVVFNPALVGLRYPSELIFGWTEDENARHTYDAWAASHALGFRASRVAGIEQRLGGTLAAGGAGLRAGWSFEWVGPDLAAPRTMDHRIGLLSRPAPWLSLGATTDHLFRERLGSHIATRTHTFGIAVRPAASRPAAAFLVGPRLTLHADVLVPERSRPAIGWRGGVDAELVSGVALRFSFDAQHRSQVGVTLRLPNASFSGNAKVASDPIKVEGQIVGWEDVGSFSLTSPSRPGWTSVSASFHSGEEPTVLVPPGARRIADIRIGGVLGDEAISGFSLLGGGAESQVSIARPRAQLERALEDPLTRGVLLELSGVANMSALEELRPRITALRAAGKPVVALLELGGGRGDLYLAAACDRVFASEEAFFMQLGLRSERRYYRKLLDQWGVRLDRVSVGKYKSAYRNYSTDSTTEADREVIEHVLDQVQSEFVTTLSADRKIPPARFAHLLDGRMWPSEDLVSGGLLDSVAYRDQALTTLGKLAGLGARPRTASLRHPREARRAWRVPTGLAVVYASGGIEVGESGNDLLSGATLGSSTLIRQLERAFRAPDVKAVVFRIDSPGGSTLASNLIHHALERLRRETGKPLVVSMGSVAASGGYYIALPAQKIFADRFTRTGSIGVLFTHPSIEKWYRDHDVRQDEFLRGDYMAGGSFNRDWDERTFASADSAILRTYDRFVDKVAASRGLTRDRVLDVAQGRVWLGADAQGFGLVDEIGGLDAAIAWARRAANLDPAERLVPREFHRPQPGLFARLAGSWIRDAVARDAQLHDPSGERYEAPEAHDVAF